ncbi:hypothetical protein O181_110681, partial [Austropuccinia psidii MF-1]|nr:hypothetical protein [Austropuccinia psidii MF-1]
MKTLKRFKLEQHIMCITNDNASSNNCMAQKLEEKSGSFNSAMQHIGCMAHVIHLGTRDGLNTLSLDSSSPDNNIPPDDWINNHMSMETLADSPDGMHLSYNTIISQIFRLASYLNQSPQWRDKFITTVHLVYNGAVELLLVRDWIRQSLRGKSQQSPYRAHKSIFIIVALQLEKTLQKSLSDLFNDQI